MRQHRDLAQFMLVSAAAMLLGVILPLRGSASIGGVVLGTMVGGPRPPLMVLLIPFAALLGLAGSVLAVLRRQRWLGGLTAAGGVFVLVAVRQAIRVLPADPTAAPGAFFLAFGALFLIGSSLLYLIRPGQRPADLRFLGPTARWERLHMVAYLLLIASTIAIAQRWTTLAAACFLLSGGTMIASTITRRNPPF